MKICKFIIVALFGATSLYAEVSAFDAGNLNSTSPYGLTSNEKILKERLDLLNNGYSQVSSQINVLGEKLDGLQSIIEGINSQYAKTDVRLSRIEDANYSVIDANLTQEIQNLKIYVEESRRIQEANNQQFKKALGELSKLIDSINNNLTIQKNIPEQKQLVNLSDKNVVAPVVINKNIDANLTNSDQNISNVENNSTLENIQKIDNSWKKKPPREIMDLAIKEFREGLFVQAKEKFELLIKYGHKPSRSNFYIGEIEYAQGNYQKAIGYYKKSSMISSKNDFTPKLLYHTAISLDKIGDIANANAFYKALKKNYPNTPEAKASPDRK